MPLQAVRWRQITEAALDLCPDLIGLGECVDPDEVVGQPDIRLRHGRLSYDPRQAPETVASALVGMIGDAFPSTHPTRDDLRTISLTRPAAHLPHPEPPLPPAEVTSEDLLRFRAQTTSGGARRVLEQASGGLAASHPELAGGRHLLTLRQGLCALVILALLVLGLVTAPLATLIAINALVTLLYLAVLTHNLGILGHLLRPIATTPPPLPLADEDCPRYTVMVPAYHEASVLPHTLAALAALDYPADRLEILLLLEVDDEESLAAALAIPLPQTMEVVPIPKGGPRTKPKALNVGLQRATGELITVYDAEDRPDPLQLRHAAARFAAAGPELACLQARLRYHNPVQNLLTRLFTLEYLVWFDHTLPAIAQGGGPFPLGGTSMHLRRSTLEQIGAWSADNVTEDCELGVRLQRLGYRTEMLASDTLEEANPDLINWVKQRSRWSKGYLQTWLIQMRHPRSLLSDLGLRGFLKFQVLVGAGPLTALLNPLLWLMTAVWFVAQPPLLRAIFPPFLFYPALFSLIVGNLLAYYLGFAAVRQEGRPELLPAALVYPLYWWLMSLASLRALLQLAVAPSLWEKTQHGLDQPRSQATRPT
jgi:cellulose synthase/poly-beta-1,6-N-acetylglucosamine synthase-like glycosyltransferase